MKTPAAQEPTLRELIASDVAAWAERWAGSGPARATRPSFMTGIGLLWSHLGLRATVVYRVSHSLKRSGVRILPGILSRLNVTLHGIDIPASVPIGSRMYVPHPVGTVVMARRIGSRVTLVSCVTVGMRNEHDFPMIGDNVYIGAGARVLGGITIGDDVAIGANAVVLRDVPDGCVAVGVPATVRSRHADRVIGSVTR